MNIALNKYIVANPDICHGKPTFKDTRVMVWQVLEMLADGAAFEEILKAFPHITKKHILAALEYATSITQKGYVIVNTQTTPVA